MPGKDLDPQTRVVRAGLRAPEQGQPFRQGPVATSTYHLAGEVAGDFVYGRNSNPTWTAYESAVGDLDGGDALVFASGMAAVSAAIFTLVRPGQTLVLPSDCYYTTRQVAEHLDGVTVLAAPTTELHTLAPRADLLWLETPSNPTLDVCDIAALAAAARGRTVVDNSTATGYLQSPLALGAAVVVCSDTKLTTGHSDLLLGHVSTTDPEAYAALLAWRRITGGIAGPYEVWLAHRSLATLGLRAERACANALAVATLLARHPAVTDVRYPGLPSHPQHALATRQMRAYGPVLGFTLPTAAAAQAFLSACTLVDEATSFGGTHSMAERRARWGADDIAEGYVRFSAGIEATADLLADVTQALDAL
ncbi:MAG: cystathionine gamma-lyase [Frankiales bacterium]|nr:cystathionine gamma-lyase [Frankiales bacterium]